MVLSHRKLKQQLRSLVAESLAATESQKSNEDVNQQLRSLRELLGSKSQKPESSKRPKRRKKPPSPKDLKPVEGIEDTHKEKGENIDLITSNEEGKSKKRRRDGDGGQESTGKKKKLKTKKKKLKKKKMVENEKEIGGVDEVSNEKGAAEPIKIVESELNAKKVYVGGIPYYSTEDDIRSFFEGCGTITDIDCMRFPESGKFRGIAILTFKTEAAAKRALALDGADMGGFYLKIQPYKPNRTHKSDSANQTPKSDFAPEIVDGYNRAYVGNLSWDITEDDLRKLFSDCKIMSIRFGTDKATDEFRGYAHVDFSDSVSLTAALKLDQKVVCGRPARIRCAVPKNVAEAKVGSEPDVKKAEGEGIAGNSKKKKRRTCYECGVPGHLSSACPRKKAVGVDDSGDNS